MRIAIWVVLAALVALHHDFWFWDDATLVGGWMPIGLLYHLLLSLVAVAFWAVAVRFAWPGFLDSARSTPERSTPNLSTDGPDTSSKGGAAQ